MGNGSDEREKNSEREMQRKGKAGKEREAREGRRWKGKLSARKGKEERGKEGAEEEERELEVRKRRGATEMEMGGKRKGMGTKGKGTKGNRGERERRGEVYVAGRKPQKRKCDQIIKIGAPVRRLWLNLGCKNVPTSNCEFYGMQTVVLSPEFYLGILSRSSQMRTAAHTRHLIHIRRRLL